MTGILPDEYLHLSDEECIERIQTIRSDRGASLVILAHLYQRQEILDLGDFTGDSFGLSRSAAAQREAEFIVFCGVHFMAESARILCAPEQRVVMPDPYAGCPMADMATGEQVDLAWKAIENAAGSSRVIPVTYMNSTAELKAFCGRHGGVVCTSSNARRVFEWAFEQGDKIFFFPDEHLGRNTANAKGIPREEVILWYPDLCNGGHGPESIERARVILWKGFCHVHQHFGPQHVKRVRREHPEAKIVVHPECREELVDMADANGSTSFIVDFVEQAGPGSIPAVGTELNLINALSLKYEDREVFELARSICPNMYKNNPKNLLWTLEHLGEVNVITVPDDVRADARVALERMLDLA